MLISYTASSDVNPLLPSDNDVWVKFKRTSTIFALAILVLIFGEFHFCAETVGTFEIGKSLLDFAPLACTKLHHSFTSLVGSGDSLLYYLPSSLSTYMVEAITIVLP